MSRAERRSQERERRRVATSSIEAAGPFVEVDQAWMAASVRPPQGCLRILKNERYFVFVCSAYRRITLLMIQRLDGRDGLTWDELYKLKSDLGYGDREAIELFPPEALLHNVANVRHLWVLPPGEVLPFGIDPSRPYWRDG